MQLKKLFKISISLIGLIALWELGTHWWETHKFKTGTVYWHTYYPPDIVARSNQIRQTHELRSTGVPLHIDIYPQPDPEAPVVIFNHGAAGYCRLFVQLALALYDRGYTVILPDQRGQGFSGGRRGDYVVAECTQNIVDAAHWAKTQFNGPLFMLGGSVGGALTYYAAAAGAPVEAIACLNLFDFGNGTDGLSISRLARLADSGLFVKGINFGMRLLKPIGWLHIPFNWLGAFDKLMDARDQDFQSQWDADPIPPRLVSLRSLVSNLNTPPAISFERNQIPVLVINQNQDQMVDPRATRQNFERLKPPKEYLEIPFGHWSSQPEFWQTIIAASDCWFQKYTNKKE